MWKFNIFTIQSLLLSSEQFKYSVTNVNKHFIEKETRSFPVRTFSMLVLHLETMMIHYSYILKSWSPIYVCVWSTSKREHRKLLSLKVPYCIRNVTFYAENIYKIYASFCVYARTYGSPHNRHGNMLHIYPAIIKMCFTEKKAMCYIHTNIKAIFYKQIIIIIIIYFYMY